MSRQSASPSGLDREATHALVGLSAWFVITAAWWALALWPVAAAPAWLARTRYVCFGVSESGLPDGGGWIGLIGGPLGMLTILLAGWYGGVRSLFARARASRTLTAALTILAAGCLLLITGATWRVQQTRALVASADGVLPPASYPRIDRAAPPLALTAQTGDVVDLAQLAGRPVLVTFAYAHCETVCPLVVKHVLDARALLAGSTDEPVVLIVTLDPWRDTPARLPAMAATWGLPASGAHVLSGSVTAVEATLDAWDVPRSRSEVSGEVTHPSLVYVIDRSGVIAYAANGGSDVLAALLRRL